MNRARDNVSDLANLCDFRRVLLRLKVLYHAQARRCPRLQEHFARKIAELELTTTEVNNRIRRLGGSAAPGGNDG
ncbi:MAG: hypothetical protein V3W11_04330 [bacterium]